MTAEEAYYFAKNNPDYDIEKYQEIACQTPCWAYMFAKYVPEAGIEYCYNKADDFKIDIKVFVLKDLWYDP